MKKVKNLFVTFLVAMCAVCLAVAFTACGSDKESDKGGTVSSSSYGYGEEGFYYYDAGDAMRYMLSLQSGTYMLSMETGSRNYTNSGSYSYDAEAGELTFYGAEDTFTASVAENSLSLEMSGSAGYSFKAYKYFDVTYVLLDENGKEMSRTTESVLNGQIAESLEIPVDGYYFVSWYEDSALTSEFSFDLSVAGDTTLYGWYVVKNPLATEFEVTLDYGAESDVWNTQNGAILRELPSSHDGRDILGWWVSATNKSGELTYRYTVGDKFTQDTTLFAVYTDDKTLGSSVTAEGITWDTSLAGANLNINVKTAEGWTMYSWSTSSTAGIYAPDRFFTLETGTYTIEVISGNVTDTLTYVVNGLDRVSASLAGVVVNGNGRLLTFSPVEGAEGYIVTVDDGYRTISEDLGDKTFYNFSGIGMTKYGLTFTVTAYADEHVSSVSGEINYTLVLGSVAVGIEDDTVVWNTVEGAVEYVVTVTDEYDVSTTVITTGTSFSLKYCDKGTYNVTVLPRTDGYYSESATYYGYAKDSLAAPVITDVTDYSVTWTAVNGADSYVVLINGVEYVVTPADGTGNGDGDENIEPGSASAETGTMTLYFSEYMIPEDAEKYEISVMARVEDGADSAYADTLVVTNHNFRSAVTYGNGEVSWTYDMSAAKYVVVVNGDGDNAYVTESGNSIKIALTGVGDNTIAVTALSADGEAIGYAETSVYAYSVTLDGNGIITENKVVYVAQGDVLNLGGADEMTLDHAEFIGWYTQPDYTEGQSDAYEGKGSLVEDGATFTSNRNLYLYAYWTYEYIDVTLVAGTSGKLTSGDAENIKIKYNSSTYVLPAPETYEVGDSFVGWFSDDHGEGIQYTNDTGAAEERYLGESTTLYAYYLTVLSFASDTAPNGERCYAVSGGTNINRVTTVTIPETYSGRKIIIRADAFTSCSRLEVINIPDTVLFIDTTSDGFTSGSGAFAGCPLLREVNIYETGEPDSTKEVTYFSVDGVLFHITDGTSDAELLYYPYGKSDETYAVPSTVSNSTECDAFGNAVEHSVTKLLSGVFRERSMSRVIVASSVTYIEMYAFRGNGNLTEVTFEAGGTGSLTIEAGAFYSESALEKVTLPSRYSEFDPAIFSGCSALTDIDVEDGGVYSADSGVLLDANGTTLVYLPMGRSGDIDIGSLTTGSITRIGQNAFASNTTVTSVVIPGTVAEIGESAFEGCSNITSVIFEGGADSSNLTIRTRAFYGCVYLESVKLPVNLVNLEADAFGGCTSLTYVYFDARPNAKATDLNFESGAFGTTNYITTVELGENAPAFDNFAGIFDGGALSIIIVDANNTNYMTDQNVLYNGDGSTVLYCPYTFVGEYTVLNTATKIGSDVFAGRTYLTKITIGANVNTIGEKAFVGCSALTEIAVAAGNANFTALDGVLYRLEEGEPVELLCCPEKIAVTEIYVPETVVATEDSAFYHNDTVEYVEFGNMGRFYLAPYTFYNAAALETVILPGDIETIYAYTFYNCTKLTYVNIPTTTTVIEEYAFYYCDLRGDLSDSTTRTYLPEGLVEVGDHAFDHNQHFAATIPSTVQVVGDYAFYYCWYEEDTVAPVVFAETGEGMDDVPLSIGKYAFAYTYYATDVEIPARTTELGNYSFYYHAYKTASYDPVLTFGKGCELETIGTYAFDYSMIVAVELPASLVEIQDRAFCQCTNLKLISFAPAGETSHIETIGYRGLYDTPALVAVYPSSDQIDPKNPYTGVMTLPASLVTLADQALYPTGSTGNNITKVVFEEGSRLETMGTYMFNSCTKLESIELPASLKSIGTVAFSGCTSLTTVTFLGDASESQLTSIAANCFLNCTALTTVNLPQGLIRLGDGSELSKGMGNSSGSGSSKKTYSNGVFDGCTALQEITIPASVEIISAYTFRGCTELSTVKFGGNEEDGKCNLAEIEDYAFYGCTALTEFEFPETTAESIKVGNSIFYGTDVQKVTLNSGITDLGGMLLEIDLPEIELGTNTAFAFNQDKSILMSADGKSIILMMGDITGELTDLGQITSIGASTFAGQTGLTAVTIPATVESIGDNAFDGCTGLQTVTFEEGSALAWTTGGLGEYIFKECTSLASVSLPNGLQEIPAYTFYSCPLNGEFSIPESLVTIGDYAFYGTELTSVQIPNVETIGEYAFSTSSIQSIEVGTYLTSIGNYAFSTCSGLTSFDFGTAIPTLGTNVFRSCTGLTSISLPEGMTTVNDYTFYGCTGLTSVTLPSTLISINQYAFYASTQRMPLSQIDIPDSVTTIGNAAFGYTDLATIKLPSSLTSLGSSVFSNCTSLTSVDFNGCELTQIKNAAFTSCSALTSVTLPDSVTSVGNTVFTSCAQLTSFKAGASLESIGYECFYNDSNLVGVDLGPSLKSISYSAFRNCTSLTSIELPSTLETLAHWAFNGCTALESIVIPAGTNLITESGTYGNHFTSCSCDIYIEATEEYVTENWVSNWDGGFNGTVYYYSEEEPALNETQDAYDGNYWHYDVATGEIVVWTYTGDQG